MKFGTMIVYINRIILRPGPILKATSGANGGHFPKWLPVQYLNDDISRTIALRKLILVSNTRVLWSTSPLKLLTTPSDDDTALIQGTMLHDMRLFISRSLI
jgi:hypothetical protein